MAVSVPADIFHNKVLLTTLAVWAVAQTIKVVLGVAQDKRFSFKWFFGTGGMPSSHAAGAAALATTCGIQEGFSSVIFAIATVFALVTMFDAQGVRRSAGKQASILNQILDDIYWRGKIQDEQLIELIGHTPFQVIVGAVLGIVLAYFIYLNI
jgi:acid phosphatase family membrane protein YuiD